MILILTNDLSSTYSNNVFSKVQLFGKFLVGQQFVVLSAGKHFFSQMLIPKYYFGLK